MGFIAQPYVPGRRTLLLLLVVLLLLMLLLMRVPLDAAGFAADWGVAMIAFISTLGFRV